MLFLSLFFRRISSNYKFVYNSRKTQIYHSKILHIRYSSMPPKRKATTAKVQPIAEKDLAAGDQIDPPVAKSRKKQIENEEQNTKKPVASKGDKGKSTADAEKKKQPTRGKKAVETEKKNVDKNEEINVKTVKPRDKKENDSNGISEARTTRKKKVAPTEASKTKGTKKKNDEKVEKSGPSNSTLTKWEKIDFSCTKKSGEGQKFNLKISTWNIGGLKSWIKKDCLKFLEYENPDVLCLQETKCSEEKLPEEIKILKGYKQYWCASDKEGYAGVGLLTKQQPLKVSYGINIPELDSDGRCITAEYEDYFIISVYVPNAGRKLVTLPKRLEWNLAFKDYVKSLDDRKPVIICGDMNVAHNEIDLARPANNTKNAGFTKEEREGMTEFLQDGYIDTFRKLYPERTDVYTFWTYMANARAKNVGWRLDYFIVSERIMDKVCDSVMRSDVLGSDHCPITLFINI